MNKHFEKFSSLNKVFGLPVVEVVGNGWEASEVL
jgi:hypothetical protein